MNTLHLEVNRACWWRRVMSFSRDAQRNVQAVCGVLLIVSENPRIRARIIAPDDTAPLMTWTASDGRKEWRA